MFFNLLPQKDIKNLKKDVVSRMLYGFTIFFAFWSLVFIVAFFTAFLYLDIQNSAIKDTIDSIRGTDTAQDLDELEENVTVLNTVIFRIEDARSETPYDVLNIMETITPMVPSGARLTRFNFSNSSGMVFLEGHAERREQVVALEENLREEEKFEEVEAPSDNIIMPRDIDFTFTLHLKGTQEEDE